MLRKLSFIFVLALGLAALLIFRPWQSSRELPPRFFDRLPEADIIGKSDVLELSRALSSTMYYFKIPIREFLSKEFILGQGKSYGVDVQKPIFFFADQKEWQIDDFGVMAIISDSSKVQFGINKIRKVLDVKDTVILNQRIIKTVNDNFYFTYGDNWLLAYQGNSFKSRLSKILKAKRNEIPPKWRQFLNTTAYNNTNAVAYLEFPELEEYGIQSSSVSLFNDSSSLILKTTINQIDTVKFSLKDGGPSYEIQDFTKYLVNLHCNTSNLKPSENDPLFVFADRYSKRVNFPLNELLKTWTGDIAYRQGGIHEIEEKYIESELDENFNVTEVVKVKKVKVPSFSLYLSTNDNQASFIKKLYEKGILTKDSKKFRLLFSPPMNMNVSDSAIVFHTGKFLPGMYRDSLNTVIYTAKSTPYSFNIDSTDLKSIYGTIRIPLQKIVEENIPAEDK